MRKYPTKKRINQLAIDTKFDYNRKNLVFHLLMRRNHE